MISQRSGGNGLEEIISSVRCRYGDSIGCSIDGLYPKIVAVPKDEQEISHVLRIASRDRLSVFVIGSQTEIGLGNIPRAVDIVISTKGMEKIIEYVPEDLTISLQSGIEVGRVQEELQKRNQFIPIDPPFQNATVGGVISANSWGPLRTRFGGVRDLLLGIRAVSPTATITKVGGKVVKNVAGYDLTKLYVGALGTLGVVFEANLKLAPIPEQEGTLIILSNDLDQIASISKGVVTRHYPQALELFNLSMIESISRFLPPRSSDSLYCLSVTYAGMEPSVSNQIREVERSAKGAGGVRTEVMLGDESRRYYRSFASQLAIGREIVCRVAVPRAMAADAFKKVQEELSFFNPMLYAEPSLGTVQFLISTSTDMGHLKDRLAELRGLAEGMNGSLVVRGAPVELKRAFDVWGTPPRGFELMRMIKSKFDPDGIMSPGRFVGGI